MTSNTNTEPEPQNLTSCTQVESEQHSEHSECDDHHDQEGIIQQAVHQLKHNDQFNMIFPLLLAVQDQFKVLEYKDCETVLSPKDQQNCYYVLSGQVNVIAEEMMFKRLTTQVKKVKYARAIQQELFEKVKAENVFAQKEVETDRGFMSDFPTELIKKNEYHITKANQTFGNDRPITNIKYRPSFGISQGETTSVLCMPLQCLTDALDKFNNSGENQQKILFFRQFDWFLNYTSAQRSRLINSLTKKDFLIGQKIIAEGKNDQRLYMLTKGSCILATTNVHDKFQTLEHADDPTKIKREQEQRKMFNPNVKSSLRSKQEFYARKFKGQSDETKRNLLKNGYLSKTLKNINIGTKEQKDWIGEELLNMEQGDNVRAVYNYSAIPTTKCETYWIALKDANKLPFHTRKNMQKIAKQRHELILKRTIDQFNYLKSINSSIYDQDKEMTHRNSPSKDLAFTTQKQLELLMTNMGAKITEPVDPAQQQREIKKKYRQEHIKSSSWNNVQYVAIEGREPHEFRIDDNSVIYPNARDVQMQYKLKSSGSPNDTLQNGFSLPRVNAVNAENTIQVTSADIQNYKLKAKDISQGYDYRAHDQQQQKFMKANNKNPYQNQSVEVLKSTSSDRFRSTGALTAQKDCSRYKTTHKPTQSYNHNQNQTTTQFDSMRRDSLHMRSSSQGTVIQQSKDEVSTRNLLQRQFIESSYNTFNQRSGSVFSSIGLKQKYNQHIHQIQLDNPDKCSHRVQDLLKKPVMINQQLVHAETFTNPYVQDPNRTSHRLVPISKQRQFAKINKVLPIIQSLSKIEVQLKQKQDKIVEKKEERLKNFCDVQEHKHKSKVLKMGKTIDANEYANQLASFAEDKDKRHKVRLSVVPKKQSFDNAALQMSSSQNQHDKVMDQLHKQLRFDNQPDIREISKFGSAQTLSVQNFSYDDQEKADELMRQRKLCLKIKQQINEKHNDILMLDSRTGDREIKDFNYTFHSNGTMINVPVNDQRAVEKRQKAERKKKQHVLMDLFAKKQITQYQMDRELEQEQDLEILKSINLNSQIAESDLSKVYVDDQLAAKLMMQDEKHEDHEFLNFGEHGKHDHSAHMLKHDCAMVMGMQGTGCVMHRQVTPNPFYHHQKRKLLIKYKQQLLEEQIIAKEIRLKNQQDENDEREQNELRQVQKQEQIQQMKIRAQRKADDYEQLMQN